MNPFNLVLVGFLLPDVTSPIAVDDLTVREGSCPPPPEDKFDCGNGESVDVDRVCDMVEDCDNAADERNCGDCDFEVLLQIMKNSLKITPYMQSGECGWENEGEAGWHLQTSGEDCYSVACGDLPDHTLAGTNSSGHFLYIEDGFKSGSNKIASYASPFITRVYSTCMLKFW